MNLKRLIHHSPRKPLSATMPVDIMIMATNRYLDIVFNSMSSLPTFVLASLAFISDRVSLPVYRTYATTCPVEAKTVFYHKVFSKDNGSR